MTIAFPLADVGYLLNEPRRDLPSWPEIQPGAEFLHHHGQSLARPKSSERFFREDRLFVDAAGAIRWPQSEAEALWGKGVFLALRRLFGPGRVAFRYEVGFRAGFFFKPHALVENAVERILSTPVDVGEKDLAKGRRRRYPLGEAGAGLRKAFAGAVAPKDAPPPSVRGGTPVVVVECLYDEEPPLGLSRLRPLETFGDLRVFFYRTPKGIPVWFLSAPLARATEARLVRLPIVRLWCERESAKSVLRALTAPNASALIDRIEPTRLEAFVDRAVDTLRGAILPEKEDLGDQTDSVLALVRLAWTLDEKMQPGESDAIVAACEKLKGMYQAKFRALVATVVGDESGEKVGLEQDKAARFFEAAIQKGAQIYVNQYIDQSVHNDQSITNSGTMTDVQNITGDDVVAVHGDGSSIDASRRQEIAQATEEFEKLSAQLQEALAGDPAAKETVEAATTMIVAEAKKEKPSHGIFEITKKGLIEAAEAVAGISGPIVTVLAKLKGLVFPGV